VKGRLSGVINWFLLGEDRIDFRKSSSLIRAKKHLKHVICVSLLVKFHW